MIRPELQRAALTELAYFVALALAGLAFGVLVAVGPSRVPTWLAALGAVGALVAGGIDREREHRSSDVIGVPAHSVRATEAQNRRRA